MSDKPVWEIKHRGGSIWTVNSAWEHARFEGDNAEANARLYVAAKEHLPELLAAAKVAFIYLENQSCFALARGINEHIAAVESAMKG